MAFRDIIGHQQLTTLLARAVGRGTLPPSLLFTGPVGVGKATTAVALAQALNCERRPDTASESVASAPWDACGACASCRRLERAGAAFRDDGPRSAIDCLQWLSPDEKGSSESTPSARC